MSEIKPRVLLGDTVNRIILARVLDAMGKQGCDPYIYVIPSHIGEGIIIAPREINEAEARELVKESA